MLDEATAAIDSETGESFPLVLTHFVPGGGRWRAYSRDLTYKLAQWVGELILILPNFCKNISNLFEFEC